MEKKKYIGKIITFLNVILLPIWVSAQTNNSPTIIKNGLYYQTENNILQVEFITPDIVRTQYTSKPVLLGNGTAVCIDRTEEQVHFNYTETDSYYILKSDSLQLKINKENTAIEYWDSNNNLLLMENQSMPRIASKVYTEKVIYDENTKRTEMTADGQKEIMDVIRRDTTGISWKYRVQFQWKEDEGLYGLGSHMEDYMNMRGKEVYLVQHNLKAMVPVLNSTAGYGLLFDAGCGMIYKDNNGESFIELEAAKQIDYYFMKGQNMDAVIANYRLLTGKAPMMPRYIFGYIQSKERYKSSDEIIKTVAEYRKREVPLDVIIQDWNYWPNGKWGYMKMDRKYYPDPAKLADDVHKMNAKLMISIWPNMTNSEQAKDFYNKGYLFENRDVYNSFNPLAQNLYWKYAYDEFFKNGFDAWWCDCTEPLDADWKNINYDPKDQQLRWKNNLQLLSDLLGAERSCTYSLYHSQGIYENQRKTTNQKRVVNLTRSSYAGQQRYATITWNGDTYASWESFAQQIPSGLNFMATGCPYWTIDIGAFFVRKGSQWFWAGEYNNGANDMGYRELYTRMFQYATFLPLQRSHGTDTPREIWNFGNPGEPFYDAILDMIRLRYRMLPYIYSLAGKISHDNYTLTRALAFDFPKDKNALDIKDQFMFGPSLLVSPVTKPMYYEKESRVLSDTDKNKNVYLPKGQEWVDFWTGNSYEGGQYINTDAPIEKIPLFVRKGSILPLGPVAQYTSEKLDAPWEIRIYPGADASFTIYEDEGDNYNYEQLKYSKFTISWNDKKQTISISNREGEYNNMIKERQLNIVVVDSENGTGLKESTNFTKVISYDGKAKVEHLKRNKVKKKF